MEGGGPTSHQQGYSTNKKYDYNLYHKVIHNAVPWISKKENTGGAKFATL